MSDSARELEIALDSAQLSFGTTRGRRVERVPSRSERQLASAIQPPSTGRMTPPSYAVHSAGSTIHDFRDFVVYNARGQGHLNSDGLCFVQPNGPLVY